jgi:hypothetical protein
MSENNAPASLEKPQELLDLEKAVVDLNAYNSAVRAGSFPGTHAQAVTGLLSFLKQTFQQLEEQYRNHPFNQELMRQAQEQAAKDEAEIAAIGFQNG